ncbi:energy-coupling factor transporter transmembrane component T family protein [Shewanella intestini]|uniref:Energy-coupling factor transporter transmembrane protein EcfT n=1 Tax=Shewanella intestini TaxID=2017544 RepID=A0ABS5HZU9_9GAMM|nr:MULTISPECIES: energy-coupling factor transporter transmembrane component T [Shewanella]MBR9727314.1 energy-coupling factor transporter transmembrane protein EcfT [Shewanella intestini]MRG35636.1 cobalt ABC transporter permease [Shewanella sp. XMDDZSB0408]
MQIKSIKTSAKHYCFAALVVSIVLASCAFFLPAKALLGLVIVDIALVLHAMYLKQKTFILIKMGLMQLLVTLPFYYFIHGSASLFDGFIVVLRVFLAILPGWWLSHTQRPERLGEVLCWWLPAQWSFVIAASIGLLPYIIKETKEIYTIQCLRGARITPKALRNPKNWCELIYCVLLPMLIELLKLSKQMAQAAQLRHFGHNKTPTHWPDTPDEGPHINAVNNTADHPANSKENQDISPIFTHQSTSPKTTSTREQQ